MYYDVCAVFIYVYSNAPRGGGSTAASESHRRWDSKNWCQFMFNGCRQASVTFRPDRVNWTCSADWEVCRSCWPWPGLSVSLDWCSASTERQYRPGPQTTRLNPDSSPAVSFPGFCEIPGIEIDDVNLENQSFCKSFCERLESSAKLRRKHRSALEVQKLPVTHGDPSQPVIRPV